MGQSIEKSCVKSLMEVAGISVLNILISSFSLTFPEIETPKEGEKSMCFISFFEAILIDYDLFPFYTLLHRMCHSIPLQIVCFFDVEWILLFLFLCTYL